MAANPIREYFRSLFMFEQSSSFAIFFLFQALYFTVYVLGRPLLGIICWGATVTLMLTLPLQFLMDLVSSKPKSPSVDVSFASSTETNEAKEVAAGKTPETTDDGTGTTSPTTAAFASVSKDEVKTESLLSKVEIIPISVIEDVIKVLYVEVNDLTGSLRDIILWRNQTYSLLALLSLSFLARVVALVQLSLPMAIYIVVCACFIVGFTLKNFHTIVQDGVDQVADFYMKLPRLDQLKKKAM